MAAETWRADETDFEEALQSYLEAAAARGDTDPPLAAWQPDPATLADANITAFAARHGLGGFDGIHRWSVTDPAAFWAAVADQIGVQWHTPPTEALRDGAWFPDARLNIVDSCFTAPRDAPALVLGAGGAVETLTYAELEVLVNRFAAGYVAAGLKPGDRVAIAMPMHLEAVVAYLGIIRAGGAVVSIADSFAAPEIATRLQIAGAVAAVTSGVARRAGRELPMYEKLVDAGASTVIVVGDEVELRDGDVGWDDFLSDETEFESVIRASDDHVNVLFSSGTTGEPKAIPWHQITPLKAAADAYFHHDVHTTDTLAWPTNLGWMMGPWLIFASLMNGASMALYDDAPTVEGFGRFVEQSGITMLGVVPSLVSAWRTQNWLGRFDWSRIRLFSSTGEPSNRTDMLYLMAMAGWKPVIEYCGGTEIAGGYITGVVTRPASPATFSAKAVGSDFVILDEAGAPSDTGELFLIPPSVGLSTELLNRDHDAVYFEGTPPGPGRRRLRRHGDQMEALPGGYYRAQGRADDTMNLGGIKVSSAEIERRLRQVDHVREAAAVAVEADGGGPASLVVFAELEGSADPDTVLADMRRRLRSELNPLFKIDRLVTIDTLPRTASNKIMRRTLRDRLR